MTIESEIFETLRGLVGNRCFPDFAPVKTQRPYITYQQIGGNALNFVDNSLPSKKHGMFQVNVWADTRASASLIALQVESAMATATSFQSSAMNAPIGDFDADIPVYGSRQDFSVWSDR